MALPNDVNERQYDKYRDTASGTAVAVVNPDGTKIFEGSITGADGAITDGSNSSIKATVKDLTNSNPVTVAIVDGTGDQITSFGGGTQYTEGDTDASITGTALMFESNTGTNALSVVSATNPLPISGTISTAGLATEATLTNVASDTTNILSNTTALANTVTAGKVQTDVASLPTGIDIRNLTSTDVITVTGGAGQTADVKITLDGESVPVTGTFYQATQPVSAASLPLPTGASTLAEQQTQTTSLQLLDDAIATTASAITTKGMAAAGTDGTNARILKTDTNGELQVDVLTLPTLATVTNITNQGQMVDNAGFTDGTTRLNVAGFIYDEVAGTALTENDGAAARINANRAQVHVFEDGTTRGRYATVTANNSLMVTTTPSTTGGWTPYSNTALSNTKQAVKASAGTLGGYFWYNPNASVVYIQVFDVASASVTVGTTTPTYVYALPGGSAANLEITNGIHHATAITIAATTTPTGLTAPGSALVGFFLYK